MARIDTKELPTLTDIRSIEKILIHTMSQSHEDLVRICEHYGVKPPKCDDECCNNLCPTSVAEVVYAKAITKRFNLDTDHAPLPREELEDELRKAGWTSVSKLIYENGHRNILVRFNENGTVYISHDEGHDYLLPLSAVTRATLRSCGVVK